MERSGRVHTLAGAEERTLCIEAGEPGLGLLEGERGRAFWDMGDCNEPARGDEERGGEPEKEIPSANGLPLGLE